MCWIRKCSELNHLSYLNEPKQGEKKVNLLLAVCIALAIRVIPEIMGKIWSSDVIFLHACFLFLLFLFGWLVRFCLVCSEVVTEVDGHELILFCPSGHRNQILKYIVRFCAIAHIRCHRQWRQTDRSSGRQILVAADGNGECEMDQFYASLSCVEML